MTDAETLWRALGAGAFAATSSDGRCPSRVSSRTSPAWKLIIELDGGQHGIRIGADEARTASSGTAGYLVMRFWNAEVLTNEDGVLETIASQLALRLPEESKHD